MIVGTAIALTTFTGFLTGCSEGIDEQEAEQLGALYAEILIARHLPEEGGSTRIDSLLDVNGFESEEELQSRIEELAREDPDGLRAMFDSTQKRLEGIRDQPNAEEATTDVDSTDVNTGSE